MRAEPTRVAMASAQAFPMLGGVESHIDEVAVRLAEHGLAVELFTTDRTGGLPRVTRRNGVVTRRFRSWPRRRDYFASPGLGAALLRAEFDLLHVQGVHTLAPPVAMLAAAMRGKPFVVTFHTGGHSSTLRTRLRGVQFTALAPILRRAASWIAVSDFEAQLFARVLRVPVQRITVIGNGGVGLVPTGVAVDPDLIVSPGRLERYKGHHRAIAAMPLILRERPDARLKILGAGPYEAALHRQIAELGLSERVSIEFIPPEQRSAMAEQLGRAAVVCLLSDFESHPVAITEALSLGRPVVALDNSGVSELIRRGLVNGLSPDASDAEVARAVLERLAAGTSVTVPALPTWDECAERIMSVYRDVLSASDRALVTSGGRS